MKVCTCFLLFNIIGTSISYISCTENENDRRVNLALETVLEFSNKDNVADLQFLDNIEKFITRVRSVIKQNKNSRRAFKAPNIGAQFTDFLQNVIAILKTYDDYALVDFFDILDDEMKKYHYRGCKFYELTNNFEIRKLLATKMEEIRNKPAHEIKSRMNLLALMLKNELYEKNVKDLADYINSLYRQDAQEKFERVLNNLEDFNKSKTKSRSTDLVTIVRDGIRSVIFDHYTDLHRNARRELKSKIETFWKQYKPLSAPLPNSPGVATDENVTLVKRANIKGDRNEHMLQMNSERLSKDNINYAKYKKFNNNRIELKMSDRKKPFIDLQDEIKPETKNPKVFDNKYTKLDNDKEDSLSRGVTVPTKFEKQNLQLSQGKDIKKVRSYNPEDEIQTGESYDDKTIETEEETPRIPYVTLYTEAMYTSPSKKKADNTKDKAPIIHRSHVSAKIPKLQTLWVEESTGGIPKSYIIEHQKQISKNAINHKAKYESKPESKPYSKYSVSEITDDSKTKSDEKYNIKSSMLHSNKKNDIKYKKIYDKKRDERYDMKKKYDDKPDATNEKEYDKKIHSDEKHDKFHSGKYGARVDSLQDEKYGVKHDKYHIDKNDVQNKSINEEKYDVKKKKIYVKKHDENHDRKRVKFNEVKHGLKFKKIYNEKRFKKVDKYQGDKYNDKRDKFHDEIHHLEHDDKRYVNLDEYRGETDAEFHDNKYDEKHARLHDKKYADNHEAEHNKFSDKKQATSQENKNEGQHDVTHDEGNRLYDVKIVEWPDDKIKKTYKAKHAKVVKPGVAFKVDNMDVITKQKKRVHIKRPIIANNVNKKLIDTIKTRTTQETRLVQFSSPVGYATQNRKLPTINLNVFRKSAHHRHHGDHSASPEGMTIEVYDRTAKKPASFRKHFRTQNANVHNTVIKKLDKIEKVLEDFKSKFGGVNTTRVTKPEKKKDINVIPVDRKIQTDKIKMRADKEIEDRSEIDKRSNFAEEPITAAAQNKNDYSVTKKDILQNISTNIVKLVNEDRHIKRAVSQFKNYDEVDEWKEALKAQLKSMPSKDVTTTTTRTTTVQPTTVTVATTTPASTEKITIAADPPAIKIYTLTYMPEHATFPQSTPTVTIKNGDENVAYSPVLKAAYKPSLVSVETKLSPSEQTTYIVPKITHIIKAKENTDIVMNYVIENNNVTKTKGNEVQNHSNSTIDISTPMNAIKSGGELTLSLPKISINLNNT